MKSVSLHVKKILSLSIEYELQMQYMASTLTLANTFQKQSVYFKETERLDVFHGSSHPSGPETNPGF